MDLMWIPVQRDWRLNERHYGALQGLNKAETAAKYGEDQVKIWRRSYDIRPPALEECRSALSGEGPALSQPYKAATSAHRMPQGHRRAVSALLARSHRSRHPIGEAGVDRGPWQQPAGTGEVSRRHSRRARSSISTFLRACRWCRNLTRPEIDSPLLSGRRRANRAGGE